MKMPWEISAYSRREMEASPARINPYPRPYRRPMRTAGYSKLEEAGLELAQKMGLIVRAPPSDKTSRYLHRRRLRLFYVQGGCCYWCSKPMELNPNKLNIHGEPKANQAYASFEHLIPKSHGGINGAANIVLSHAGCNNKRHRIKWPHDPIFGKGERPVIQMNWTT